jgi:hypothetical protein
MTEPYDGGCLCGHVRYRATGAPLNVNYCHCTMCLKQTGAPVAAFVTFPRANITFSGAEPTLYRSSEIAFRGFCPKCGSALVWQRVGADKIDFLVGSLDDPARVQPREHLWTSKALPWLHIEDDLPRHLENRRTSAKS